MAKEKVYEFEMGEVKGPENPQYLSKCCMGEVKLLGIPDFIGDEKVMTVHYACRECGKDCDIIFKQEPEEKPSHLEESCKKEASEEYKEVTAQDSVFVIDYNRILNGLITGLEHISKRMPSAELDKLPEYEPAMRAVEQFRRAAIQKIRELERLS